MNIKQILVTLTLMASLRDIVANRLIPTSKKFNFFNVTSIESEFGIHYESRGTVTFYDNESYWTVRVVIDLDNLEKFSLSLIRKYETFMDAVRREMKFSIGKKIQNQFQKKLYSQHEEILQWRRNLRAGNLKEIEFASGFEPLSFNFKEKTVETFVEANLTVLSYGRENPVERDTLEKEETVLKTFKAAAKKLKTKIRAFKELKQNSRLQVDLISPKLLGLIKAEVPELLLFTNILSYYEFLEAKEIYYTNDSIFTVDFQIPIILERNLFNINDIHVVPTRNSIVQIHSDYILFDNSHKRFTFMRKIDLEKCVGEFDNNFVCEEPTNFVELTNEIEIKEAKYLEADCLIGALQNTSTASCRHIAEKSQFRNIWLKNLNKTAWIYSAPKKSSVYLLCNANNEFIRVIIEGMGIIQINENCVMKTFVQTVNATSNEFDNRNFNEFIGQQKQSDSWCDFDGVMLWVKVVGVISAILVVMGGLSVYLYRFVRKEERNEKIYNVFES